MDSVERELELVRESLDRAMAAADDEMAKYHIRMAAQRLVFVRTATDDEWPDGNLGGETTSRSGEQADP